MTKMTEAQLIERDRKRNLGEEVLQAIREIKAAKTGRVFVVQEDVELAELVRARSKEPKIKKKLNDL